MTNIHVRVDAAVADEAEAQPLAQRDDVVGRQYVPRSHQVAEAQALAPFEDGERVPVQGAIVRDAVGVADDDQQVQVGRLRRHLHHATVVEIVQRTEHLDSFI